MKAKLIIFVYMALLPSIIYSYRFPEYVEIVKGIAKNGGRIEGVFQPEGDEPLGEGHSAFVYAGTLFPSKKRIAMKFTPSWEISLAEKEYKMYTYLDAINNPNVEQYGIPCVYYLGKWEQHDLFMLGISLFDQIFLDFDESRVLLVHDVNVLIILRDFILTSKYIHSHGVRHDDIDTEDIMVRGHRSFLADFNLSSKMNERSRLGYDETVSRRAHTNGERYPKDDWENFLYSFCFGINAYFYWFGLNESPQEYYAMKSNLTAIRSAIDDIVSSERMKEIMIDLAEHIFDDGGEGAQIAAFYNASNSKRFPDYNRYYKLVDDEIKKLHLPPPAMFTWLTRKQKKEAVEDFIQHGMPDITQISDPKEFDFSKMKHLAVDFRNSLPAIHDGTSSSHHSRG